jgi:pimeloyl-ACP methyl ester carboxylesterase
MTDPTTGSPTGPSTGTALRPGWLARALARAPEHGEVTVDGTAIHYRRWGRPGLPGLILVHGGAAHSGWWDHIAPQLTSHAVVALDLSGHGDSGRRETYGLESWAREVAAVADATGLARPVVVGHSLGGWVSVTAGVEHGDRLAGVAVIDSPLNDQPPEEARLNERRRPTRVYPTAEEAIDRFRTLPPQEVLLPGVKEHVARQSLRPVEGGWTWKFDPFMRGAGRRLLLRDLLPDLRCPVALFRCENGLVSPEMAAEMAGLVEGPMPVVDLPDAGHHPMLDQPLALVTALRTLLAFWPSPPGTGRA